jgi:hypothetical protein
MFFRILSFVRIGPASGGIDALRGAGSGHRNIADGMSSGRAAMMRM